MFFSDINFYKIIYVSKTKLNIWFRAIYQQQVYNIFSQYLYFGCTMAKKQVKVMTSLFETIF